MAVALYVDQDGIEVPGSSNSTGLGCLVVVVG